MKWEWLLLGLGAYFLYSRSSQPGGAGMPFTYPPSPGQGSRSTGSGGTTASGGGIGTSSSNPPVGGQPGNPTWGPVDSSGYVTCSDGTMVNDPSLCPMDMSGYITCADGSVVNDPSLCMSVPGDMGFVGPVYQPQPGDTSFVGPVDTSVVDTVSSYDYYGDSTWGYL